MKGRILKGKRWRRIILQPLFFAFTSCLLPATCYLLPATAFAEDQVLFSLRSTQSLSLQDAYRLALKRHEAVKIAEEVVYQSEQERKKALSTILPTLTAEGSYTKYPEEKTSIFTVIQPDYSYNYYFKLTIPVYRGGREWSALRQAGYMLKAGEKGLLITRESIIMEVSQAYYGVLKAEREIEIMEADLKRGKERRRVAQARFKVGEVTKVAVLRAEADLAGIQADLKRAKKDLLTVRDRLARLVGLPPWVELIEPLEKAVLLEDVEGLIKTALDKRSDYLKLRAEEEIAREGVRYARGGYMPTLKLDGVYAWRDQDPISAAFFNRESIFATATLTFPLYEGGLRLAEVKEAESKLRESELKRIDIRKNIEIEVREAFYNLDALSSAVEFYGKQVSFAEENYNTVFKQFTYGLATNLDVIDANSTLVAAQESLTNSTIDIQVAILELKRRMGILMEVVEPFSE